MATRGQQHTPVRPGARPSERRIRSRWQRDNQKRRRVLMVGVISMLIILAIPAYGYVSTFVLPPRQWVVQVNDESHNMGYLLKLLRMFQQGSQLGAPGVNLGTLPFELVQYPRGKRAHPPGRPQLRDQRHPRGSRRGGQRPIPEQSLRRRNTPRPARARVRGAVPPVPQPHSDQRGRSSGHRNLGALPPGASGLPRARGRPGPTANPPLLHRHPVRGERRGAH